MIRRCRTAPVVIDRGDKALAVVKWASSKGRQWNMANERDDYLHDPADDDRWWSETYWFSFDDPGTKLSCHFYPLFRRNLGIAALQVFVWEPGKDANWSVPYYKCHWHLPCPAFEGARLELDQLSYEIVEPMSKYRVRYNDPGRFVADLQMSGATEIFTPGVGSVYTGHIDQPMKVTGSIELCGQKIDLDCHGMRDRSWGLRSDHKDDSRAYYFYGISDEASFLVINLLDAARAKTVGFVEADGRRGRVSAIEMEKTEDAVGRADYVKCSMSDDLGRSFTFEGKTRNHFPVHANPHQFAWLSMIEWQGGKLYGQFQEVCGRERLAELACDNFTLRA